VTVAGTYTLTVSNGPGCESTCSITVTTTPKPVCEIIGNTTFCEGTLNKLCGTPGAASYLWSTGETTECIDVSVAGTYTLTVSNGPGCESTCTITVTTTPPPACTIIGNNTFCEGTLNKLCGTPGAASYLWSTGETSECIDVSVAGTYTLTVSNGPGCESTCSITVTTTPKPVCTITGNDTFCEGSLNKLCGTPGAASYLWSTGETTECIDVTSPGTYSLTVSNGNGCISECVVSVTVAEIGTPGAISGPIAVTANEAVSYSIEPVPGATSYTWTLPQGWTGDTTGLVINVTSGATNNSDALCVQAVMGGCTGPNSCIQVSFSTGISTEDHTQWFVVQPNPSHGAFQLVPSGANTGPTRIMVYDALGKLVVAPVILNGTQPTMIHMEGEAPGTYFLRAIVGNESRVFHLLIQ